MIQIVNQPEQSGTSKENQRPDAVNSGAMPPEQGGSQSGAAPNQGGIGWTTPSQSGEQSNGAVDGSIGPSPSNTDMQRPSTPPGSYAISRLIKADGRLVGYELSNGQKVSCEQCVEMAKNGQIDGVAADRSQSSEYKHALSDNQGYNNFEYNHFKA